MAVIPSPTDEPDGTVLVLRALGLGDLLTAVPALRALRRARPAADIVLAAPGALTDLALSTGSVDEVLPMVGLAAPPAWMGAPPALAVNLHGRGPQSTTLLQGIRPGTLWTHTHPEHPDIDGPRWDRALHEVTRWCRMVEYFGVRANAWDLHLGAPEIPSPVPGAIAVHPGAGCRARQWPPERFAAVVRSLAHDWPDAPVVITGGPGEHDLAAGVAALASSEVDRVMCGDGNILELAALVAGAALVVSGDTGIAHLATAYRTPSVTLFGPTSPERWGPSVDSGIHTVLWAGTTGDPHADRPDPGLLRVDVESVLDAAGSLQEATHV
ncbi:glycosyltransferase family 9 protein [Tomitella gaofuii]|uniref:glycosyltransferase family 9 protein n=1 Tax=Tomitella gaofuii TaxID=2760083 RepID=UPI002E290225|nr:glycosyltransferase family 9 protein [Tomitella gaofuii]